MNRALGPDPPAAGRAWSTVRAMFGVAVGALLALYVGFFVVKCVQDIRCPYTLDYGEGLVLSQVLRLAHGQELYNDYTHYPFVFSNYPPLFHAVAAIGARHFGASFGFGRALAFGAMLGTAGMMVLLLRRCGVGLAPALGAPAFLLSTYHVVMWSGFMRVDSLALLLSMGGLYCVLRGGKWLIPGVVLMVAAIYTKQSMVAGLAASVVYLWWIGERRNAVLFLAGWAGAVLVIFAVFEITTHGWFYRHMVTANAHPWFADQTWRYVKDALLPWPVLFIVAGISAAVLVRRERGQPNRDQAAHAGRGERLLVPYLGVAAVLSLTVGKAGASVNYMIELLAATCMVASLGYQRLTSAAPSRGAQALWGLMAVALLAQVIHMWRLPSTWDWYRNACASGGRAAARIIAQTKGDIIGDPPGVAVLSGRPLLLDPATASCMALGGKFDLTPVLRDIRRRRFSLIYMSAQVRWAQPQHDLYSARWSVPMMEAILRHYRDAGSVGDLCFLVPRQSLADRPRINRRGARLKGEPAAVGRKVPLRPRD